MLASLTPGLEVGAEFVFCEPKPLQLSLHAAAGFQQSLPLVQPSLLREWDVEANGAPVPRHLNRCRGLEVRGQLGPELANANPGGHGCDPVHVYTL